MGLFTRPDRISGKRIIETILVVEDEPLVAFDHEHAILHAGYRVVDTVDRYDHAVEVLTQGRVDLVIADIRLRGEHSGLDLARHARALDIPVLLSSGQCPPEARELAVGWLAKPCLPRELVRAVRVVEALVAGRRPRSLPPGMTLFAPPVT